jgi:hypothetical protein
MKRLLVATFGIAAGVALLNCLLMPSTRKDAEKDVRRDEGMPGNGSHAIRDEHPQNATPDGVPPNPPRTAPGVTLHVPELPPILLDRGNDAPSDKKIDAMTQRTDLSDTARARMLIAMLPALPEKVLARAAEEAVTRLPDADYTAALRPTLINPQTHGMAMSVLFADLMQRPNAITLPILVSIAQDSNHPYAQHARENLQFLLGQDFGADWAKWNEAIRIHPGSSNR